MATEQVKWFSIRKGYGFIVNDEDNKEIFVHFKDVDGGGNAIRENDLVECDVEKGAKGLQAKTASGTLSININALSCDTYLLKWTAQKK